MISIQLIQRSLAVSVYNFDVEAISNAVGKAGVAPKIEWRAGPSTRDSTCLGV